MENKKHLLSPANYKRIKYQRPDEGQERDLPTNMIGKKILKRPS